MEDVPGRTPRPSSHLESFWLLYALATSVLSPLYSRHVLPSLLYAFHFCMSPLLFISLLSPLLFSVHFFAPFNSFCLNFSTLLSSLYSLLLSSLLWLLSLLPLVLLYSTLLFPTLYMCLPFTLPYISTSIHFRLLYSSLFHFPRFPTCQTSSPFAFLLSLLPCCHKIDASEVSLLNFLWPGVEQIPIHVQIKMALLNQVDLLYIGCHVFLVPFGSLIRLCVFLGCVCSNHTVFFLFPHLPGEGL